METRNAKHGTRAANMRKACRTVGTIVGKDSQYRTPVTALA